MVIYYDGIQEWLDGLLREFPYHVVANEEFKARAEMENQFGESAFVYPYGLDTELRWSKFGDLFCFQYENDAIYLKVSGL